MKNAEGKLEKEKKENIPKRKDVSQGLKV